MNRNPYEDTTIHWAEQQYREQQYREQQYRMSEQANRQKFAPSYYQPAQPVAPRYEQVNQRAQVPEQARKATATPARMPKAQALGIVDTLKKGVVMASVVAFSAFGVLAAGHTVVANHSSSTPNVNPPSFSQPNQSDDSGNSSQNSGGFFNQQGGGGYGFGSSNSQAPVTGSNVS